MKMLVCIKQILDPDLPARDFKIDSEKMEAVRGNANLVTNIFCENALETALQLREKAGGGSITALCYGGSESEDSLRKALAMTADEAVLVVREGSNKPDGATVAKVLAAAIRHLGSDFDAIFLGRESGDWGVGQTGGLLAEELSLPALAFVDSVELQGDRLRLQRQTDSGVEVAVAETPAVLLITNNEKNVPRIPKTRDVMMSYRKTLLKLSLGELGLDTDEIKNGDSGAAVVGLEVPSKNVQCELMAGDTLDERVDQLARRVHAVLSTLQ